MTIAEAQEGSEEWISIDSSQKIIWSIKMKNSLILLGLREMKCKHTLKYHPAHTSITIALKRIMSVDEDVKK